MSYLSLLSRRCSQFSLARVVSPRLLRLLYPPAADFKKRAPKIRLPQMLWKSAPRETSSSILREVKEKNEKSLHFFAVRETPHHGASRGCIQKSEASRFFEKLVFRDGAVIAPREPLGTGLRIYFGEGRPSFYVPTGKTGVRHLAGVKEIFRGSQSSMRKPLVLQDKLAVNRFAEKTLALRDRFAVHGGRAVEKAASEYTGSQKSIWKREKELRESVREHLREIREKPRQPVPPPMRGRVIHIGAVHISGANIRDFESFRSELSTAVEGL